MKNLMKWTRGFFQTSLMILIVQIWTHQASAAMGPGPSCSSLFDADIQAQHARLIQLGQDLPLGAGPRHEVISSHLLRKIVLSHWPDGLVQQFVDRSGDVLRTRTLAISQDLQIEGASFRISIQARMENLNVKSDNFQDPRWAKKSEWRSPQLFILKLPRDGVREPVNAMEMGKIVFALILSAKRTGQDLGLWAPPRMPPVGTHSFGIGNQLRPEFVQSVMDILSLSAEDFQRLQESID